MAIEKINMQLAGLPPAWMSRIVGQTGAFGNATEIKKLLGVVSRNPALTIPDRYVKPGTDACVYEP